MLVVAPLNSCTLILFCSPGNILILFCGVNLFQIEYEMVRTKLNRILTNLHGGHSLCQAGSLAHMDEVDIRACICASHCKVLCSPHNCLPAHHFGNSSKPSAAPFPWKVANWSCSCCRCISSFSLDSLHTRSRSPSPSSWRHTRPPSLPQTLVFLPFQPFQIN